MIPTTEVLPGIFASIYGTVRVVFFEPVEFSNICCQDSMTSFHEHGNSMFSANYPVTMNLILFEGRNFLVTPGMMHGISEYYFDQLRNMDLAAYV